MAYGPLAALIAMEQGQQLDLAAVNAALRADIAAAGGNSAFRSPEMTRTLDTLLAGGVTPGSSSVPQFSFDDLFPSPIPMSGVTATANATPASAASGGSPIATGLDVLLASFDMLMRSEEARRAGIDQQIDIANLFAQTMRASPTQAAELAVRTGLTDWEPDLNWANAFATGAHTTFGGQIGSQNVSLPWAFSGSQLSFLKDRPNVSAMLSDIGAFLGRPDILSESLAALLPANRSLIGMAG